MGLKWSAVDFENSQVRINNNLLYSGDYGVYQDTTKTDTSNRTVRLAPETMELLKEYRQWWEQVRRGAEKDWNYFVTIPDGRGINHTERANFLFIKDTGNNIGYPMNPDSITSWLNKFSEKNNLPHINPHAFRHTLASVLCLNGIDITTISKWLGHKDVTTTIPVPNSNTKPAQHLPTIILINKGRFSRPYAKNLPHFFQKSYSVSVC